MMSDDNVARRLRAELGWLAEDAEPAPDYLGRLASRLHAARRRRITGAALATCLTVTLALVTARVLPLAGGQQVTHRPAVPSPVAPDPVSPRLRAVLGALCWDTVRPSRLGGDEKVPSLALVNHRGDFAYALFSQGQAGEKNSGSCLLTRRPGDGSSRSIDGWHVLSGASEVAPTRPEPMTGPLKIDGGLGGWWSGNGNGAGGLGVSAVHGRTTSVVRAVVVLLDDGTRIAASTGHGSFAAVWTGRALGRMVTALDDNGHVLGSEAIRNPPRPIGPPKGRG